MIKVLVTSPCDERSKEILESVKDIADITYIDGDSSEGIPAEYLNEAEIIIGEPDIELLKQAPSLKLLQLAMAGTDKYTLSDGFPAGVILSNASGAFGGVISQYVVGAILNICHKFYKYRDNQKNSLWHDEGIEINLSGKRVLIVGAGNIGSSVAHKLSVFGTENIGIRRNISDIPPFFDEMHSLDELDSQLPMADIVVACIPNSYYTRHMFNEKRFMLMKKEAVFVNVGRGALVVESDLVKVMKGGHLAGAVLDVTETEPLPSDSPLWEIENLIITPHISGKSFGHSREITDGIYKIAAENIRNMAEGKPLRNVIDFKKFRK